MPPRLRQCADRPLDIAEHFPPEQVVLGLEPLEHVALAEERDAFARDRVHLRELLGELLRQLRTGGLELRPGDDPPANRLPFDELHREGVTPAELAEVTDWSRNAYA